MKHGPANRDDAESAAKLAAIFNTVVDGIITIDERGIIESVNPAAERIFGWSAKDLIGRSVNVLIPEPWRRHHDGYIRRYLRTGRPHIIGIGREVRGLRKNGDTFPMDLAVSEVRIGRRRLFTGIVRDITERKRAAEAIARVSEEERRRLGQELHDGLGQQLTGLALMAKALHGRLARESHPAAEEADELARMMGRILDDMRRQAHGLYPVELERSGLQVALEELALANRQLYGIRCRVQIRGSFPALDKSHALHLYRIAQEAVHNAIRHGGAKQICIRLARSANEIHLEIEDNGRGFQARQIRSGMGIQIMRYRAGVLGAELAIERRAPRGTLVRLVWPVALAVPSKP
ncbi:MAG: PAS domain S-box protein [Kiritimatiellae bacterium]|nr:PAS domain S-box protein [Kiritimatiellia bacterium]MDW8457759.1 PAS domain S-box protein [Verrucomicrobiota bacterium]